MDESEIPDNIKDKYNLSEYKGLSILETENLLENSRKKLMQKHIDLICANSIADNKTGFSVDTNQVTLITPAETVELPLCSKEETADRILTYLLNLSSRS